MRRREVAVLVLLVLALVALVGWVSQQDGVAMFVQLEDWIGGR
jgi:hypothetical protein